MKIKLKRFHTKYKIDYWLITITPIVDTINGLFLLKHGVTEISIGTVYRLLLLIYMPPIVTSYPLNKGKIHYNII